MNVSAIFIRRPVMTTLVMLGILVFGIMGYRSLPISNLPQVDYPTLVVSAGLPGAAPETMAATVATVLERQFTTVAGIDSMNSTSTLGSTSITLQFSLDRSIDSAAEDVQAAIAAALPLLPQMPSVPSFRKYNPANAPILYLVLGSTTLPLSAVDEAAENLMGQRISMVPGVAQVEVYGSQKYAVRIQVNPDRLYAYGLGLDTVEAAVVAENQKQATGTMWGENQVYNVQTNDMLYSAAAFSRLIVGTHQGAVVRLGDVGRVLDDVQNDLVGNWSRRGRTIVLAVQPQPNSNIVQVIDTINALLPELRTEIPGAITISTLYDRSIQIRQSVNDVEITLVLTIVLVILVIFLFLRNFTATIIPSLALPVSLIGTFGAMALLNFSIDNLSLMAMTLCVGFVVDDAIVMLENIVRHLEHGEDPMTAAFRGSEEVGFTIVSMTTSLVAVFIPLLFMGGLIGRLFWEFAVTMTVAILLSGAVSLSLTPMLCSRFLRSTQEARRSWLYRTLERLFDGLLALYRVGLDAVLRFQFLTLVVMALLMGATAWLFVICPKGFIPSEDTGQIFGLTQMLPSTSFDALAAHQQQLASIVATDPNVQNFMSAAGGGFGGSTDSGRLFLSLVPLGKRKLTADQVIQELRKRLAVVPGIKVYMQNPPSIKIGGQTTKGLYQVTLQSLDNNTLIAAAEQLIGLLGSIHGVQDPNMDIEPVSPQATITVDRNKAGDLGLTSSIVDQTLGYAYAADEVSQIYTASNEYWVILQVLPQFSTDPSMLGHLAIHNNQNKLIPLSAFSTTSNTTGPLQVNHLGELPSATVSFNLAPGVSLGTTEDTITTLARGHLPPGVTLTFQGNAKQFQDSLASLSMLLVVAVLVIYIVLGILYESFAHPLTILAGLPPAALGALLTLIIFHSELDVYSFLGLVLLIGIVKKNAIMMIDHALVAERGGLSPYDAIHEACLVRFRPIMMTTMCALMGSFPIALGFGAGGTARQPLGLAVCGGLAVSQLLTLFITPVVYLYIDRWSQWRPFRVAGTTP